MKYLSLVFAMMFLSFGVLADTNGTATTTETVNYVDNTTSANFVQPLTMGGAVVTPFYNTATATSATCATNQLIFEAVNTTSALRGSGAPSIGNYGYAIGAKVIIPFGDGGKCEARAELVNKNSKIDYARNKHNLCLGEAESFKRAKPDVYLNDNFFDDNEEYETCRGVFILLGMAHKQQ